MSLMPATWGEIPGWGVDDENEQYRYEVDETIRIPFLQLTAGDCANFSWRWEDGMDRKPQYWQKRNLFSVLYGGSPMFFINEDGYGALRRLIKYTCDYVCRWNQQIGDKEMLYHRYLNADQSVQESCWTNGAGCKGVVVNFGAKPYHDGSLNVPASDYVMFEETDGRRTYHAPPVSARDCDFRSNEFTDTVENFEQGFGMSLRSDFSPDRAQFCGTVSNRADVISGQYSMVAENCNPNMPPFMFLQTRPEVLPLQKGDVYQVTFTYRVLRAGGTLTCSMGREGKNLFRRVLSPGQQETVTVTVTPQTDETVIQWLLTGTGRVAVDDVQITSN